VADEPAAPSTADTSAPAVTEAPATVASTFTLSGTVSGNPPDTTVTLTITGPGGQFVVEAPGGSFSVSGLAPGDYSIIGEWTDSTGTATGASRMGSVTVTADSSVSLSF
jgi:hypothetical protein